MELQYDGADRTQLREALAAYGLAPNKGLGQNFLCDARACDAIVSAAGDLSQCHVLEIGPGPGALTVRLIQKAKKVTALELDAGMCRLLEGKVRADTFTLVHGDALKQEDVYKRQVMDRNKAERIWKIDCLVFRLSIDTSKNLIKY